MPAPTVPWSICPPVTAPRRRADGSLKASLSLDGGTGSSADHGTGWRRLLVRWLLKGGERFERLIEGRRI